MAGNVALNLLAELGAAIPTIGVIGQCLTADFGHRLPFDLGDPPQLGMQPGVESQQHIVGRSSGASLESHAENIAVI